MRGREERKSLLSVERSWESYEWKVGSESSGRSQSELEKQGSGMHKCEITEVPDVEGVLP